MRQPNDYDNSHIRFFHGLGIAIIASAVIVIGIWALTEAFLSAALETTKVMP